MHHPAAERNLIPIRDALRAVLAGRKGRALEIGSGSGRHIADWASAFPAIHWQPTEFAPDRAESIRAWARHAGAPANLAPPIHLDAASDWGPDHAPLTLVISLNVIHIAPWAVAEGILRGAAEALAPGGLLAFYGPFREGGVHTGAGNAQFDAALKAENPAWGLRDVGELAAHAARAGFDAPALRPMPANNRLAVFARPV